MEEIWKSIDGFEGYYEVSNTGRVRSVERQVSPKQKRKGGERVVSFGKNGYAGLMLYRDGNISKKQLVHRAVAKAFIPNPENKPHVNHINSIRNDNRVENLEWCTSSENRIHGIKYGNVKTMSFWTGKKGKNHPLSKVIVQKTLEGEIIAEYYGSYEAQQATGIRRECIVGVCAGKFKTLKGYKWEYKS